MKKKRATSDEPIIIDTSTPQTERQSAQQLIKELIEIVSQVEWPYKTMKHYFWMRDKALLALLFLTGLRVSEALTIKQKQTRIFENKILIVNVQTLKHGKLRDEIDLPKIGSLAPLTAYVEEWLQTVEEPEHYIFPRGAANKFLWKTPLGRYRAFWIVKSQTGKFPHWARAVCATIYGKVIFHDAFDLKEFMGWRRLDSSSPYVQTNWKAKRKRVNLL